MKYASPDFLAELDRRAEEWKAAIRASEDVHAFSGKAHYVASDGDDRNDGLAPERPWKTLAKVSRAPLAPGDAVLFRRGDLFRGQIVCRPGVTYAAWGEGEKPKIYGWEKDLADPDLWECFDAPHHIYRLKEKILDCGTLVFNEGEFHSLKLIPSCIGGEFYCRDNQEKPFVLQEEMTGDLDLFCDCRAVYTTVPSHGETWPVPDMRDENLGDMYLRCDKGNPGEVFSSIEALPGRNTILAGTCPDIHIDNLCLKYCGAHAIGAKGPCVRGLRVTNCEIGWVGGTVQHYLGTDPNYPEGTRGSVTRYGNGIEIYGGCEDYLCAGNYIYQVYDAGVTHQYTVPQGETCIMKNVRYTGNLIEYCVYSIEYFLSQTSGTPSLMDGLEIDHNFLRFSGFGWGQQRHNTWTPAHIKSWTFENPARNYRIYDNVFDRARYRLLHLCGETEKDLPVMEHNTYIQYLGLPLGQFGADRDGAPPVHAFFETSDPVISSVFRDRDAETLYCKLDRPL